MIRRLLTMVLCVMLTPVTLGEQSPNELIEATAARLLQTLEERRDELSQNEAELFRVVDESLLPSFDTRYAAQRVLAKHWRTASNEQRERFIDAFYQALLKVYGRGLLQFTADTMEVQPFRGDPSADKAKVRTQVKLEDGKRVPVHYSLHKGEDGWKVWDVTIEGVSFVKTYRTDFGSEIGARGLDAVIERLEAEGIAQKASPAGS